METQMIHCDYCTEVAVRLGDRVPLCGAHAREHYGKDWRMDTTALTARKASRYHVTGTF